MHDAFHFLLSALVPVARAAATYQWEVPFPPAPGGGTPDTTIESLVNYIYSWGLALGGVFAFVRLIWAGMQWGMDSKAGNVFGVGQAQNTMKEVGFGLLVLLGSWLLLSTINPQIVSPQVEFPQSLGDVQPDTVGGTSDNLPAGTQTTGDQSGAFRTAGKTTVAATLGFGSNSIGGSLTKLLENIPLGDVLSDTWNKEQAPQTGVIATGREGQAQDANSSFKQFCATVAAAYPTPPEPRFLKQNNSKSIIKIDNVLNNSCGFPSIYRCTKKKYVYTMPIEGDATECRHWGPTPVANDIFTTSQDYTGTPANPIAPGLTAPVLAFVKGTIISSYADPEGGNAILLAGKDQKVYYYAHMCINYVKTGQEVESGQVLGMSGNTGLGGGKEFAPDLSHLHFAECAGNCPTGAGQLTFPNGEGNVCPSADFGYIFDDTYQQACSKDLYPTSQSKWCCNAACPWDKEAQQDPNK